MLKAIFIDHMGTLVYDTSEWLTKLLDECVEDVGKEKDLYAKLARIKSKNKNILELKKIISSTHETVTNMYKMEESYGYNYKEYDEKMDNHCHLYMYLFNSDFRNHLYSAYSFIKRLWKDGN